MKAIDYIFLVAALFLVIYLTLKINELSTLQIVVILAMAGFSSFQFSLRRQMRKKMNEEEKNAEKMEDKK